MTFDMGDQKLYSDLRLTLTLAKEFYLSCWVQSPSYSAQSADLYWIICGVETANHKLWFRR